MGFIFGKHVSFQTGLYCCFSCELWQEKPRSISQLLVCPRPMCGTNWWSVRKLGSFQPESPVDFDRIRGYLRLNGVVLNWIPHFKSSWSPICQCYAVMIISCNAHVCPLNCNKPMPPHIIVTAYTVCMYLPILASTFWLEGRRCRGLWTLNPPRICHKTPLPLKQFMSGSKDWSIYMCLFLYNLNIYGQIKWVIFYSRLDFRGSFSARKGTSERPIVYVMPCVRKDRVLWWIWSSEGWMFDDVIVVLLFPQWH